MRKILKIRFKRISFLYPLQSYLFIINLPNLEKQYYLQLTLINKLRIINLIISSCVYG